MGFDYRRAGSQLLLDLCFWETPLSIQSNQPNKDRTSRDEKLSLLSSILGPDAMERLRESTGSDTEPKNEKVAIEPDREAWHHNRLLERLRQQGSKTSTSPKKAPDPKISRPSAASSEDAVRAQEVRNMHLDARLAKISNVATLGQEHPAIIARLIKALARDERVEALKSLSGPMARSIVRRLR